MATVATKWFCFDQNNSGGSFDTAFGHKVLVEAVDASHATARALDLGIYFDGCDSGIDCSCCGDRWSRLWGDEGSDEPLVYGQAISEYTDSFASRWPERKSIQLVPITGEPTFVAAGRPA